MRLKYIGAAFGALVCLAPMAGAEEPSFFAPFVDEAHWSLLTRSLYMRRDYQHGYKSGSGRNKSLSTALRSDYAEEWGLGLMGSVESGFTRGTLGFGLDAHLHLAQKLMGDDYRVGKIRMLPVDKEGYAQDGIARGGVAAKMKLSNTVIRYGEQRVKTPIFSSSDSRLLPEGMYGWFVDSKEFDTLTLRGGHFTGLTPRNSRSTNKDLKYGNYANVAGDSFDLIGGIWTGVPQLSLSVFAGRLADTWRTSYAGAFYSLPLGDQTKLTFDSHIYVNRDTGDALAGKIRNTTGSLMTTYQTGAHKFGLGWQKVHGDTPFDYASFGAIWLSNCMQLSDFNGPREESWQLRYELDGKAIKLPGASMGAAYIRGSGIDGTHAPADGAYKGFYGQDGKHWERDVWIGYTASSGIAKGTSVRLIYSVHRANKAQMMDPDTNQIRLSVEFPMGG
jgi:imipenem/basic amino acid-specific outer membrane pore